MREVLPAKAAQPAQRANAIKGLKTGPQAKKYVNFANYI